MSGSQDHIHNAPSSPEDGGNFRRSLDIDMKVLVGDAVGNVSFGWYLFYHPLYIHARVGARPHYDFLRR